MKARWWLLLWFVAGSADAVSPVPADFAYGMEITVDAGAALVEVVLPPDVYRAATRADLGDMRVFNAAGEVVPHVVRPLATTPAALVVHTPPLFPVYATQGQVIETVEMSVQRDAQGRIERIATRPRRDDDHDAARRIVAYVADLSSVDAALTALELEWNNGGADFLGTISVQTSDDLTHWSTVIADAGVARLNFEGDQLERRRIEFPPQRVKYLRIVWPTDRPLPELSGVEFEEVARASALARFWEKVALVPGDKPGEYTFVSPGRFPSDRARVVLSPPTNRVVHATLFARTQGRDAWTVRGKGPVYRLALGPVTITSPELELGSARGAEWMLRLTPDEGLESVEPALELGWTPHRLVFVASGQTPFRLAYGSAGADPAASPLAGVLTQIEERQTKPEIVRAVLGPQLALGGPGRLSPSSITNWRVWALWASLVLAVGLLGWMAARLWRGMVSVAVESPPAENPARKPENHNG